MATAKKPTRIEVNCETGETSVIELTAAEILELETAQAEALAAQTAQAEAQAQKAADRAAGIATLKELGLTDAQITALVG
jgi:hypothetical protein